MFKVLLKPLTLSHMDANGLFGTTKVSIFQPLQIYDTVKCKVHHIRFNILLFCMPSCRIKKRKKKTCIYQYFKLNTHFQIILQISECVFLVLIISQGLI